MSMLQLSLLQQFLRAFFHLFPSASRAHLISRKTLIYYGLFGFLTVFWDPTFLALHFFLGWSPLSEHSILCSHTKAQRVNRVVSHFFVLLCLCVSSFFGSAIHVRLREYYLISIYDVFHCNYYNAMWQVLKIRDYHSLISYCSRIGISDGRDRLSQPWCCTAEYEWLYRDLGLIEVDESGGIRVGVIGNIVNNSAS